MGKNKKPNKNNKNNLPSVANSIPSTVDSRVSSSSVQHIGKVLEMQAETFSGPLPKPDILRQYNEVIPNGAERIMKMAEDQAQHRQHLEKTVIGGDSKRAFCGIFVGGFVALCILGGAVFCILQGHDWAGGAIASLDIVSIIGVFVYGTNSRKTEREDKAKLMAPPRPKV